MFNLTKSRAMYIPKRFKRSINLQGTSSRDSSGKMNAEIPRFQGQTACPFEVEQELLSECIISI